MEQAWLEELREFISIPSVSADPAHRQDVVRAAEWLADLVKRPGGEAGGTPFGGPEFVNTTLPVEAQARFTIRLAPGQELERIQDAAEQLLREAAPEGAELEVIRENSAPPGLVPTDTPPIQLALDAFERAVGRRPLLVRAGGTLPIVPALVEKGIPTVLSG